MQQYGLLGGMLGHSLSPVIHKAFFKYTGKSGSYELLETAIDDLPRRMEGLYRDYAGINVTIPHKLNVIPFLDGISPEAAAIGAVNTIRFTKDGSFGYNTDYFGFSRLLEYNGIEIKDKMAVVLGSGGAARAVVKCLADKGIGAMHLVTRNPDTVDKGFRRLFSDISFIGYEDLSNLQGDLLVNCTPVGMYPNMDATPVSVEVSSAFAASVDLIYNPAETIFLQQARLNGKMAVNGLFMLVAQAVAAQEIWQDEQYDSELILKIIGELQL